MDHAKRQRLFWLQWVPGRLGHFCYFRMLTRWSSLDSHGSSEERVALLVAMASSSAIWLVEVVVADTVAILPCQKEFVLDLEVEEVEEAVVEVSMVELEVVVVLVVQVAVEEIGPEEVEVTKVCFLGI